VHARLDRGQLLPTKKAQALLRAVPFGQAHPREKLAILLWGDMQDTQARSNPRYPPI
jgi:DNA-binding SARP family transcriptional activator